MDQPDMGGFEGERERWIEGEKEGKEGGRYLQCSCIRTIGKFLSFDKPHVCCAQCPGETEKVLGCHVLTEVFAACSTAQAMCFINHPLHDPPHLRPETQEMLLQLTTLSQDETWRGL